MSHKLIHQIWVGPHPIPQKSIIFIEKIKKLHPHYEYKLWTDADLNSDNFSNLDYINATPIYAQKADIMRYEILYKYGGVYLDIDFEIFKCLDPLLTRDLVVCNEDSYINKYMTNAFIYSIPGTTFLKNCVDNIKNCPLGGEVNVAIATGPWYFRKQISLEDARVLPTHVMYPTHWTQHKGFRPDYFSPETYGMHHWDKNW
jgi:mannosyltransferase OCH1-like enzyme